MAEVSEMAFEALKDRVNVVERLQAVKSATDASIETRLTKIETVLSRLTWLMVSGIGGAAIAFVVSGGLNVAT
jgi:hypothetical protein